DILAIQESYIRTNGNTESSPAFITVLPSTCYSTPSPLSRSAIPISKSLNPNSWQQIPFLSPDVTIVQLCSTFSCCTIINVYNDCNSHDTEEFL
ncbi:hypothetical protein PAXRUDRAFT_52278, partial [Paxillus rubicundulus Ve08.2h10]